LADDPKMDDDYYELWFDRGKRSPNAVLIIGIFIPILGLYYVGRAIKGFVYSMLVVLAIGSFVGILNGGIFMGILDYFPIILFLLLAVFAYTKAKKYKERFELEENGVRIN